MKKVKVALLVIQSTKSFDLLVGEFILNRHDGWSGDERLEKCSTSSSLLPIGTSGLGLACNTEPIVISNSLNMLEIVLLLALLEIGTISFGIGFFFVIIGWPVIGMAAEAYGFIILFSGFWPTLSVFVQKIPIIGWVFQQPFIRSVCFSALARIFDRYRGKRVPV
ncbi:hypothetical protein Ccrd_002699 [Cynara cardunculus var. scolymus]|uniref:Uncharacterized protein n=1 Tax=Cynara cardunculus var. scolymus TaxID=59895 RepID=A0A124SCY6_CYNCS|nr:hypothetical protein Ccrd_002699 [Cynara cardunculus var. scolymus]